MVLAVLVLLTLTSVGIVSVQRTSAELLVAGNVVRSSQSGSGGEAGGNHSLVLVAKYLPEIVGKITTSRMGAIGGETDTKNLCDTTMMTERQLHYILCRSSMIPDPQGEGAGSSIPLVASSNPISRSLQNIAQSISVVSQGEEKGRPGDDVDGNFCYQVFDFNARGGIPTQEESVEESLCLDDEKPCLKDTVVVENRIRAVVGPMNCLSKQ